MRDIVAVGQHQERKHAKAALRMWTQQQQQQCPSELASPSLVPSSMSSWEQPPLEWEVSVADFMRYPEALKRHCHMFAPTAAVPAEPQAAAGHQAPLVAHKTAAAASCATVIPFTIRRVSDADYFGFHVTEVDGRGCNGRVLLADGVVTHNSPAPCDLVRKWLEREQSDDATAIWLAAKTKECPKSDYPHTAKIQTNARERVVTVRH
jgi:hypothetical protein